MLLIGKACVLGLFAVLIARLVNWLGLGASCNIGDDQHAIKIAHLAQYGFLGRSVIMAVDRRSAIVEDAENQHIFIRQLGSQFITRPINAAIEFDRDHNRIVLRMAEMGLTDISFIIGTSAIRCAVEMLGRINERVSKSD